MSSIRPFERRYNAKIHQNVSFKDYNTFFFMLKSKVLRFITAIQLHSLTLFDRKINIPIIKIASATNP